MFFCHWSRQRGEWYEWVEKDTQGNFTARPAETSRQRNLLRLWELRQDFQGGERQAKKEVGLWKEVSRDCALLPFPADSVTCWGLTEPVAPLRKQMWYSIPRTTILLHKTSLFPKASYSLTIWAQVDICHYFDILNRGDSSSYVGSWQCTVPQTHPSLPKY